MATGVRDGRLFRDARGAAGRVVGAVVTVPRFVRLMRLGFALSVGSVGVAWAASAPPNQSPYATYGQAMVACVAYDSWYTSEVHQPANAGHCNGITAGDGAGIVQWYFQGQTVNFSYKVKPPPDNSACGSNVLPQDNMPVYGSAGKILEGSSICVKHKDNASGATVSCKVSLTPAGAPYLDKYSGQWVTNLTANSAGALCGSSQNAPDGTVYDSTGAQGSGPALDVPLQPKTETPQICGGGSCYDPASNKVCATMEGKQTCVSVDVARTSTGGCASSGSGTLCSGSPNAPKPPPPPQSPISDPPSMVQSVDKQTIADKTTGANQTITTVVYAVPGSQVSSGAKPTDKKPAPAEYCVVDEDGVKHCVPKSDPGSSYCVTLGNGQKICEPKDGKDKGKDGEATGGEDCTSPPICTGDQPTCMGAMQTWQLRCKPRLGEDADGTPKWTKVTEADKAVYATGDDIPISRVVDDGNGSATGDGGQGADGGIGKLDTSGWAGNTCPSIPTFSVFGHTFSLGDQTLFCDWLAIIRAVVLLVAAFVSARILISGGRG